MAQTDFEAMERNRAHAPGAGFSKIGLLSSRYTMTGNYFVGRLHQRYGLGVLVVALYAEGRGLNSLINPS